MSRKKFIESLGATCRNWTWSWSFVNHQERFVIFGAWDINEEGNRALILKERWAVDLRGKKKPAYAQSREHIRLAEEEGYALKTFSMQYEAGDPFDEYSPAKIKGFTPRALDKHLLRIGDSWYASNTTPVSRLPEELDSKEALKEGVATKITVNRYERNAQARDECLGHHGTSCSVCAFDFGEAYGAMGRGFIHVHHIVPLCKIRREYIVDPKTDLVPICPNCHAMIHSTSPALAIDELKRHVRRRWQSL